jgi:hypothetical protein
MFEKPEDAPIERPTSGSSSGMSALPPQEWRKIRTLVKDTVSEVFDEREQKKADKLMNTVMSLTAQLNLQRAINEGLGSALLNKKKRRKRSKNVFEDLHAKDSVSTTFFSRKKIQEAMDLQKQKDKAKKDEKRQKEVDRKAKEAQCQIKQEVAAAKRLQRQETIALIAAARAAKVRQKEVDNEVRQANQQLNQQL